MKQYLLLAASAFLLQGCQTSKEDIKEQPLKMIEQIDFSHVKINDNFWSPRLSKHVSATLPVCIDQIENQTDVSVISRMQRKGKESIPAFSLMIPTYIKR